MPLHPGRTLPASTFDYLCLFFFFFFFFFFFCQISKWIRHRYTCVPHPVSSPCLLSSIWVLCLLRPLKTSLCAVTFFSGKSFHEHILSINHMLVSSLGLFTSGLALVFISNLEVYQKAHFHQPLKKNRACNSESSTNRQNSTSRQDITSSSTRPRCESTPPEKLHCLLLCDPLIALPCFNNHHDAQHS